MAPQEHTGKIRIQDTATGLYLVAPVSGWRDKCAPEWTDIPEASFRFSRSQAQDQRNFLHWNCKITARSTSAGTSRPDSSPAA